MTSLLLIHMVMIAWTIMNIHHGAETMIQISSAHMTSAVHAKVLKNQLKRQYV